MSAGAPGATGVCSAYSYSMSLAARNAEISAASRIVRRASGTLTTAMVSSLAADRLEQKLEDLDVALGLGQRPAPRVQTVPANEEAVRGRMLRKHATDVESHPRHVLIVLDDGHPFAVRVGRHAVETLQHLEVLNRQPVRRRMPL